MLNHSAIAQLFFFIVIFFYQPFIAQAEASSATTDKNKTTQNSVKSQAENKDLARSGQVASLCNSPSTHYKKKLAATFFPLQNPQDVGVKDFYGFEKGIGRELLQRLAATNDFLVKPAQHINLYPDTGTAPYIVTTDSADNISQLAAIGKNLDVQYVIAGVIRNLSYADFSDKINLPFGLSINKDNFVSLTQQPNKPNKRNLVIDFYLYDVLTEELIDRRHFAYLIESNMAKPDYAIEFASREFFASDYGQLFDKMLNEEVLAITTTLSCRPYTLRVIDKDKKNIYLNVGSQSRVKTGDILTMYRADIEAAGFNTQGHRKQFGWPQSQLRITKVFPAYSIAVSNNEEVVHLEKNKEYLLVW